MRKTARKITITVIIFITVITFITPVKETFAQSRSITLSPPSIKLTLKPGEKIEKTLKITNHSSETLEFFATVEDFIVTNQHGTPELLPPGVKPDNKYSGAAWTAVMPDTITVLPGKSASATLYLQIPGDARPGGRYFSVAFRPINNGKLDTSGAYINTVVGSLVYLTVEGPLEENARITQFKAPGFSEFGPINFETEIKNEGDLHAAPKAVVVIKDMLGRKVYAFPLDSLNIFPGTSRIYQNTWAKKWLLGRFTADLSGTYGQENLALAAGLTFWVLPYKLILTLLLALAIVLVGFFYFRQKQTEGIEVKEEASVEKTEKKSKS